MCLGTRVQLHLRLLVILKLSQIPADPCAVLALFVSLEIEFDEVNPAFMDEIGEDDAQRTVPQIPAGQAALTINRDSVCVKMQMRLEDVGGTAASTSRNKCKSVGSDLYFLESLKRSR